MNPTGTLLEGIRALSAPIIVTVLGILALILDLGDGSRTRAQRRLIYLLSIAGLLIAALFAVASIGVPDAEPGITTTAASFGGGMVADRTGGMLSVILCLVAGLAITMSDRYLEEKHLEQGEFYALILFATAGAMIMAMAFDLVNVFVGLEVLSVSLYILSGFVRRDRRSEESAVKYFLLGAFASGFLLYGTALVYGAVGLAQKAAGIPMAPGASFTNFGVISDTVRLTAQTTASLGTSPLFIVGVALLIVGLGFKAAIVPFHSYAPDVYEGAPTPVTAFMSAAAKIGAFAALIRLFAILLPADALATTANSFAPFHSVLWGLALATMIVGNVLAIRQTNLKRMLAYSSIAHAGYILVGVLASSAPAASQNAQAAVVYYLFTYAFMNLGAFAMIIWLGRGGGSEYTQISDYAGLAKQQPFAAAVMALFMLSLSGIPPAAGFLAKLYIFTSAVQAGMPGLACAGLVVSAIGVFYYLNIIVTMYFRPGTTDFRTVRGGGAMVAAVFCAFCTLVFGLFSPGVFAPTLQADPGVEPVQRRHPVAVQPAPLPDTATPPVTAAPAP